VGYRASSRTDYDLRKKEAEVEARLIHENEVSGRTVAIYQLEQPYRYGRQSILGFEIVAPRADETCASYWEHVEFVSRQTLQELVAKYPNVQFDQSAISRAEFPKVAIRFEDGLSAKFHTKNILEEVAEM
jgi:predicted metalloenzyme YecM